MRCPRVLASIVVLSAGLSLATPRDFSYTWTTETIRPGASQFEGWLTSRIARTDDFVRFDARLAWATGVVSNLDTQLSVDPEIERTDKTVSLDGKVSSLWRWTTWKQGNPFALGGLGRLSVGVDRLEVEGRLLMDLKVDRVLFSLNAAGERTEFWNGRAGIDTRLESSAGLRLALSSTVTFGLEGRLKTAWERRVYRGTALYLGPTLSVTNTYFSMSFGGYAQVWAHRGDGDRGVDETQELRDNERFQLRLTLAFPSGGKP